MTDALEDAQAFLTYYFVPGYELDPARMHNFDLHGALNGAVEELTANANPPFDPPVRAVDLDEPRPPGSVELTTVPYRTRGGNEVRLDVRSLNDSYILTTTALRRGEIDPNPHAGPPVNPHVPRNFVGLAADKYLGKLTIFAAELPDPDPTKPSAAARPPVGPADLAAAADAYATRHGFGAGALAAAAPDAAVRIDLRIPPLGQQDDIAPRCVVVYKAGADVRRFIRIALPELFLYHLKARALYRDATARTLPTARDKDEAVRAIIDDTEHPARLHPDLLLDANDRLTTELTALVVGVSKLENAVHTAGIAQKNFDRAAADCGFDAAALPALRLALVDDWVTTLRDLADASLGYRRRTRDVARVHFESLQATVEVHQTRETRRLGIVLALLTCAQVAGVILAAIGDGAWQKWLGDGYASPGWVAFRLVLTTVLAALLCYFGVKYGLRRKLQPVPPKYEKPK